MLIAKTGDNAVKFRTYIAATVLAERWTICSYYLPGFALPIPDANTELNTGSRIRERKGMRAWMNLI
jgi:hypothetical protein